MEEKNIEELSSHCETCVTKPCQIGCPLNNDITQAISYAKEKEFEQAYLTLSKTSVLMSVCSRICPKEEQCENSCVKKVSFTPVQIGAIEQIIGDMGINYSWNIKPLPKTKYKVAVIGSGPASLTCAAFLRRYGVQVKIFEKHNHLGGLLIHGIPDFRLPREITEKTIESILNEEIEVRYGRELGKNLQLSDLEKDFHAIFIGIGANQPKRINLKGSTKTGVYYANEFLENKQDINFQEKTIAVYGGGNTAMDIARIAKREGASKVYLIYRKDESFLSAFKNEIESAKEEGIEFLLQTCIQEIKGENHVESIIIQRTIFEENELILVENSEMELQCDYVFLALGSQSSKEVESLGLELTEDKKIKTNLFGQTSNPKVYAGGDITKTKSTVAFAARSGRNAAYEILKQFKIWK